MEKNSHIWIDEEKHMIEAGPKRPSILLKLAGKSTTNTSLVQENGHECDDLDQLINVESGDRFTTKKRTSPSHSDQSRICYTVNGESLTTDENLLPVREILRNAGTSAAIDNSDLDSYYLENILDGRKYEQLDSLVSIVDGDNFMAIHVGSTPVADSECNNVIMNELKELGLEATIVHFSNLSSESQQAVMFNFTVHTGSYRGNTLQVALSFQEGIYPEYPPHFIHFKSSVATDKIQIHTTHQFKGEDWSAFSLPPSDFWDTLQSSEKNMKTYIKRHLFRIFSQL